MNRREFFKAFLSVVTLAIVAPSRLLAEGDTVPGPPPPVSKPTLKASEGWHKVEMIKDGYTRWTFVDGVLESTREYVTYHPFEFRQWYSRPLPAGPGAIRYQMYEVPAIWTRQ